MNEGTNERTISSLSYRFPKPSFLLAEHHWATSLLNRLFTEQPLPWDTSSLSCFLSGLLLLWPASALSYLSYFSGLTSATQFFLWRGELQHHEHFLARSRANAFRHLQLQSRKTRMQQQIDAISDLKSPAHKSGTGPGTWNSHILNKSAPSLESPPHFSDFQKWSLPFSSFTIFSWNWALTTVSCAFSWQLCQICGNTDPPLASHHTISYL